MTLRDKMMQEHTKLMGRYKDEPVHDEAVDKRFNDMFNDYLVITLNIQPLNLSDDDYVSYYKRHNVVLIPSHLSANKKETKPLVNKYKGATVTNWSILPLLGCDKPIRKLPSYSNKRGSDDEESDDDSFELTPNKGFNELVNNCIQALTGENSNLITIDIDYAFKCFELFLQCYETSQLCTMTKNGFHFHYLYNPKLRVSKTGKYTHGFDIKNNTAITMPPSYYDVGAGIFSYKFFKFNSLTSMPDPLVNYINELMSDGFQEIDSLNNARLTDLVFLKIIDLIPVSKSDDTGEWFRFGRICALLKYPVEYFDYFSKKSAKYDLDLNLHHYNKIYTSAQKTLKKKKDLLTEQETKEIELCKPTLSKWITQSDVDFFNRIRPIIDDFNHSSVANYFHSQNLNKEPKFIYNDKWYCFNGTVWEKDEQRLSIELDLISSDFKVYSFFHYSKKIEKVGNHDFKENVMKELIKYYKNDSIKFDNHRDIIAFKNGKLNLRSGEFSKIIPEDYISKTLDYDWNEEKNSSLNMNFVNEDLISYCNDIYQKIFGDDAEEMKRFIAYCMTGEINHATNILFNIGIGACNGKSTIAKIISRVLPIYYHMVGKDTFDKNNSKKDKSLVHCGAPVRFVFLDELDTKALDVNQLKLMTEEMLEVKPLYKEAATLHNHCKLYICSNSSPRFKPDNGLVRRALLVEAKNKFISNYTCEKNTYPIDIHLIDNFDKIEYKLAWIHLHLPYIKEMYNKRELCIDRLKSNFENFAIEVDLWMTLKDEWLEFTGNDNDRISKQQLADLFYEKFNIRVIDRTAVDEGKRIGLNYVKNLRLLGAGRSGGQGVFVGMRIKKEKHVSTIEKLKECETEEN